MGEINCHCHVEQTSLTTSFQALNPNILEKPKEQNHKKTKSRVNSIISPRQIIGLHSKTNSAANINLISNCYSNNTHSEKVIKLAEDSGQYQGSRRYILQVGVSGHKYEKVMGNEVVRVGAMKERTGKYDIEIEARKEYQTFSLCCRLNKISNTISVKDNGVGLGVFQFIKQGQVLQISSQEQSSTPYIVLDIGVGKFVLIKRKPTYHQHKPSITYSLVTNRQQLHKIPKSLPSLFDVGEDYPQYNSTQSMHNSVEEGESQVIQNKVELEVVDNKIKIKSIDNCGFYRYLAEYQELSHGKLLRCGVSLYDVLVQQANDLIFRLSPR